jgi:hypothetical protein
MAGGEALSEGIGAPSGAGPEAGGMPKQAAPTTKKFFLLEYLDEVRRGAKWMREAPKAETNIVSKTTVGLRKWSKLRKARIGMVVVVVIIVAASGLFAAQAGSVTYAAGSGPVGPGPTGHSANFTFNGTVTENGNISTAEKVDAGTLTAMKATLTWSDEPAGLFLTNQPDALGLKVTAPNGQSWTVNTTTTSPVTWTLPDGARSGTAGDWNFTVLGGTMGDVVRSAGGGPCPRCGPDTKNAFALKVEAAW